MKRYTFQVNMHYDKRAICAVALTKHPNGTYPLFYGPNLPTVLRRIKKNCSLNLQDIVLEFQPE